MFVFVFTIAMCSLYCRKMASCLAALPPLSLDRREAVSAWQQKVLETGCVSCSLWLTRYVVEPLSRTSSAELVIRSKYVYILRTPTRLKS